jgi:putative glutamine amidotransferase
MTTARPVLGIIACQRTVGTEPAQAVIERYLRPTMQYADVAALIVPSLPDLMSAAEVVGRLDGILLTGSPSNVETHRYHDKGGEVPFDPGRDEIALSLVDRMTDAGKPVFGICRGFQEINVALGGTLRRDVSASEELLRHHAPDGVAFDDMFNHVHAVTLTEGGVLRQAFGKNMLAVNSVHYQGIGRLADGLAVEAMAPDGLVEAYSTRIGAAPVIAVQWHPEWNTTDNPDSQAFFRLLGRTLRGQ